MFLLSQGFWTPFQVFVRQLRKKFDTPADLDIVDFLVLMDKTAPTSYIHIKSHLLSISVFFKKLFSK